MNRDYLNLSCLSLILLSVLAVSSCVKQEYNINNLDTTIHIGGKNFSLPLGSTKELKILDLIPQEQREMLKPDADGVIGFNMTEQMDFSDEIHKIAGQFQINPIDMSHKYAFSISKADFNIPDINTDLSGQISLPEFSHHISLIKKAQLFDMASFPKEVQELKKIKLQNTFLDLEVVINNLPELNATPQIELTITFPEEINKISSKDPKVTIIGNTLTFKGIATKDASNTYHLRPDIPIEILELDLSNIDFTVKNGCIERNIEINGRIFAKNPTVDLGILEGTNVRINLNTLIPHIEIAEVRGKIDYSLNESQIIDLTKENVPDFLKGEDFNLDLMQPHIILKIDSNVGIPVNGDLTVTAHYEDGSNFKESINGLAIPGANNVAAHKELYYWLAKTKDGMPSGYTHLQADIPTLLKKIPQTIDLQIQANTNTNDPKEHVIEPGKINDYRLNLDYNICIPFVFGKELNIHFESDIDLNLGNDKDIIINSLKKESLAITGNIVSTLPLELCMNMIALDSMGEIIPTEEIAQIISACQEKGKPANTDLNIVLKLKEDGLSKIDDLTSLKMIYTISSGNAYGIPVTDDVFIQAKLAAKIPGGFTFDPINPDNSKSSSQTL